MILISILFGLILGTITGVLPGIHPNLIASVISQIQLNNIETIIFITAVTHTFINTIPAVYLYAPEASTCLLVHPAQEYNKKGKSHEAVLLTLVGSLISLILIVLLSPILINLVEPIYSQIKKFIPFILISVAAFLLFKEKEKFIALTAFLISGILGYQALGMPIKQPLLPLFTGLFGIPGIITTLKNKKIPTQRITAPEITKKDGTTILSSGFFGSIFSFLPGLGPSQSAIIQSSVTRTSSPKNFLIIIGCLNTIHILVSLLTAYTINKARSGPIATILEISIIDKTMVINLILCSMIIAFPVCLLCISISRGFVTIVQKVNHRKILLTILIFLIIINWLICRNTGIIILLTATFVGIIPYKTKIRRTTLMGSLIIPTTIYYLTALF